MLDIFDHFPASQKSAFDSVKIPMKLVVCPPTYLSNKIPNNQFMSKSEKVDVPRAMIQWQRMVNVFNALDVETVVLPATPNCQDATFCSNVAVSIEPYIVLSNFSAAGRSCEEEPARKFFEGLGYQVIQPPTAFEGYAELKHFRDDIYFGGFGQFTDVKSYQWIADKCKIRIIPIRETEPTNYHLDTLLIVLDERNVLLTENATDKKSIKAIEKVSNITVTPPKLMPEGITNGVILRDKKIYLSGLLNQEEKDYRVASEWLMTTMDKFGLTVVFLDTDATQPSGAALSCQSFPLTFQP